MALKMKRHTLPLHRPLTSKIDAACRHFMRGLASLELLVLDTHGAESEAPHFAFAPALDVKIDAACRRHFMRGLASLELLVLDTHGTESEAPHLAFAPALDDVKN